RPPKSGSVVGVEGKYLLRQALPTERLDGKVPVNQVVLLRRVLEEKSMADGLISDAIAHHDVVGAVHRHPPIVRIPDACADDGTSAHRVAGPVQMDRLLTQHPFLSKMPDVLVRTASRPHTLA